MSDHPVHAMRRSYENAALIESEAGDDPLVLFARWFDQATKTNPGEWFETNAMTLATATPDGEISARIVLLKAHGPDGFRFFTNYASQKGQQLAINPRAALVWYWAHLERQVRAAGSVEKLSRAEAAEYFATRPRASQLGAAASDQTQIIASREELAERFRELDEKHADTKIPMPEDWGGYLLRPTSLEFWQGRPGRLHDRLRYTLLEEGVWRRERLCP